MYVLFVCNCCLLVDLFVCVLIFVLVVHVCCVLFVCAWCYESGGTSSVVSVVVIAVVVWCVSWFCGVDVCGFLCVYIAFVVL